MRSGHSEMALLCLTRFCGPQLPTFAVALFTVWGHVPLLLYWLILGLNEIGSATLLLR